MRIANDVLNVLDQAETEGNSLRLTGQLDRKLYERTNKVLEAAGGKWNRKARAHIFGGDARDAMEQVILTGEITVPQDFGYFPTPAPIVERLLSHAEIRQEHCVLEPSAGTGAIALPLLQAAKNVDCIELLPKHVEELRKLLPPNTIIEERDFLSVEPQRKYDRVVMNPPFAKQADILHVLHALKFLKPSGRLVSVMSAGVSFRENRLTAEFRALVDERNGWIEPLPEDSFKASGTSVNAVIAFIPAD